LREEPGAARPPAVRGWRLVRAELVAEHADGQARLGLAGNAGREVAFFSTARDGVNTDIDIDEPEAGSLPRLAVSGGGNPGPADPAAPPAPPHIVLTDAPIDTATLAAALRRGDDGAIVTFDGIVRNQTRGRRTLYLFYEAYPQMALAQMKLLAAQALAGYPIRDVVLVHRLGRLEIGETSVFIAVASPHRAAAFDACRWLIDTLKQTVPIWKKEFFEDGAVWVQGEPFPPHLTPQAKPSVRKIAKSATKKAAAAKKTTTKAAKPRQQGRKPRKQARPR